VNNLVIGVDIAKRVFQLHWVEKSGEIKSVQLRREKFLEHFANRAPCLVGVEACGGSQHWARELQKLGHEVRLMSAHMVKSFVGGNKNDAADARAIWTAVQQPDIKGVAVKSEGQQAVLALHRMRLRGSLSESDWPVRHALHSYRHPGALCLFQRKPASRSGCPASDRTDGEIFVRSACSRESRSRKRWRLSARLCSTTFGVPEGARLGSSAANR
jgi:hypothetical protein